MYRIAKTFPFLQFGEHACEQACDARPSVILQSSPSHISQFAPINIILPDPIRFVYPNAAGCAIRQEIDVHVFGENAHGVCFLSGGGVHAAAEMFRIDLIAGPITRIVTGEILPVADWVCRVRRRFAMDCKTDALPLSSMLITVKNHTVGTAD